MRFASHVLLTTAAVAVMTCAARAHFIWVVTEPAEQPTTVRLYFGEVAGPDDPELLDRVTGAEAWIIGGRRSEPKPLTFKKDGDALVAEIPAGTAAAPVVLRHTYGVISRGEEPFLLKYYGKGLPSALPGSWTAIDDREKLPLEIVPRLDGGSVAVEVRWQGAPVKSATVTVHGPGLDEAIEGETDEHGVVSCALKSAGLYSIRARMIDKTPGEHDGKTYAEVRHYSTLSLPYLPAQLASAEHDWPVLPQGTTSFGAAVADGWLYVYGGHYGEAHHYSREGQSGDFRRLNLRQPTEWESLPGSPKLTGLALVEHGGKLYRVGGFTAQNGESEEQSLWSQDSFARFNPQKKTWASLPPLPEGRSSHDAAVVGDTLYVVGGWNMQGDAETKWHDTAWSVDLSADSLEWKQITPPPFHRRAVALAAWQNRLYVLGGMQDEGGTTTRVAVYDPATKEWSEGPKLLGSGMDGFGSAAFACGGRLYATTMSGSVQRLAADGANWEFVGQLTHPRFFHRVLPATDQELVIVGGAHMSVGKIVELERLPLATVLAAQ
jgi:N-acetylneuraminic acid mutarotase